MSDLETRVVALSKTMQSTVDAVSVALLTLGDEQRTVDQKLEEFDRDVRNRKQLLAIAICASLVNIAFGWYVLNETGSALSAIRSGVSPKVENRIIIDRSARPEEMPVVSPEDSGVR